MRLTGPFGYWLALAAAAGIGTVLWLAWLAGCALIGLLRLPFRAARRRRQAREQAARDKVAFWDIVGDLVGDEKERRRER